MVAGSEWLALGDGGSGNGYTRHEEESRWRLRGLSWRGQVWVSNYK